MEENRILANTDLKLKSMALWPSVFTRSFFRGLIFGFLIILTFTPRAQAQCVGMTVSAITTSSGSCAAAGASISVTITFSGIGTNRQIHYLIGFLDGTNPLTANNSWFPAGQTCPGSNSNTYYTSPVGTNTITVNQTVTVPSVAWTLMDLMVMARDTGDGTSVHCDGAGNCTDNMYIPFTICAVNTATFTKTPTPTYTLTPCTSCTKTFTPTPTNTPIPVPPTATFTFTFTPTVTLTPTITNTFTPAPPTNTFTVTFTATPFACNPIPGQTAQNLQGGTICFNNTFTLLDASYVFGMNLGEVKSLADYQGTSIGNPVTLNIQSDWKLSYFSGNLTYDPASAAPYNRLNAYGILVVDGNLTLNAGAGSTQPSRYGGVVFCTGNVTINAGCEIDGAVIIGSGSIAASGGGGPGVYYNNTSAGPGTAGPLPQVVLNGSAGNFGQLFYSPGLVTNAQKLVGQYREDVSQRRTLLAVPNL